MVVEVVVVIVTVQMVVGLSLHIGGWVHREGSSASFLRLIGCRGINGPASERVM